MKPRILVVDDNPDLRQMLLCTLEPFAEASQASNGIDALRLIRDLKPRLMLLDVGMPEMGGLELLQSAFLIDPNMIVVMLTGEFDLAVAARALDLGARTYITKPFESDVLCAEIRRLLGVSPEDRALAPYRPWRVAA